MCVCVCVDCVTLIPFDQLFCLLIGVIFSLALSLCGILLLRIIFNVPYLYILYIIPTLVIVIYHYHKTGLFATHNNTKF